MNEFDETLKIISELRSSCPSDKIRTESEVLKYLYLEIDEIREAIKKQKIENIVEEVGDVLFNVLFLSKILNEEYGFNTKDILDRVNTKMKFRHPHVFEEKREVSLSEAENIWNERKKQEREEVSN